MLLIVSGTLLLPRAPASGAGLVVASFGRRARYLVIPAVLALGGSGLAASIDGLGVREILWEFGLRPSHRETRESEVREPVEQPDRNPDAPGRGESPLDSRHARVRRPSRREATVRIERIPVKG